MDFAASAVEWLFKTDEPELPPGTPPSRTFQGPWLETQLALSLAIGFFSFIVFSWCRTRYPLLFAPRTKLKGFSPHEAHAHQSFFAWILPTLRTSEFTILQIVGLDAAVLLNFLRMSFLLFTVLSLLAITVIMPINYYNNIPLTDDPDEDFRRSFVDGEPTKPPKERDWYDLINDVNTIHTVHLLFTYAFTIITLRFIYTNYKRFVRSQQLFSLELVHSIPARTVMVTDLPNHLRGERVLAEYFENMNLPVESVSLCRELKSLEDLIEKRTDVLLKLENAWVDYVGNPSTVESYDPSLSIRTDAAPLINTDPSSLESQPPRLVVPNRPRPIIKTGWFKKEDAIELLDRQFKEADEQVRKRRQSGKFKSTHVAFVTFETMSSAQIATQVVHAPYHSQCITCLAPEPRDIVWSNLTHSPNNVLVREILVMGFMFILFFFWLFPVGTLASLLSYAEVKKAAPWLGKLVDLNPRLQALVQTSLPSLAVIALNGLLPFLLEGLSYLQGLRARSWIEASLLKKYFLFLLVNVVFIFLLAGTYWELVRDLANSPAKIPEKLASALKRGNAKHFFLSYVILQGLGIMPLQLLNLGVIIPRIFQLIYTRTPRDFAELNAPPMVNYGAVYPQSILIFVITIIYSVVQPLILIFGAVYFGVAYVVYKYKLLFVFYKPYESRGQAWPITFHRMLWGVIMFQLFMTGIFTLSKSFILSSMMAPLIMGTVFWGWYMDKIFDPLSSYVSLSSVFEVQRGEETADFAKLRSGHPVTWSQSNLNRRRYAQNDETLYVAPEDDRTDYSQPPMSNWYYGILNTGKRRYGHPALTGILPQPWLPIKKGQSLANYVDRDETEGASDGLELQGRKKNPTVVLTLRKRFSKVQKGMSRIVGGRSNSSGAQANSAGSFGMSVGPATSGHESGDSLSNMPNPWSDATPRPRPQTSSHNLSKRLSFDHATGIIMLPDNEEWLMDGEIESESEEDFLASHVGGTYGAVGTGGGLAGPSGQTAVIESGKVPALVMGNDEDTASVAASSESHLLMPGRRPATYYHHPEKRRTMPGAFTR